jgi:hypothetical protein
MLRVSTKNSVKKGQKCKYTFIIGNAKTIFLINLSSNVKCTLYDEYTAVKGKVNALMETLIDESDVHFKRHPCVKNEILNKNYQLKLTRVPSGPKNTWKNPHPVYPPSLFFLLEILKFR